MLVTWCGSVPSMTVVPLMPTTDWCSPVPTTSDHGPQCLEPCAYHLLVWSSVPVALCWHPQCLVIHVSVLSLALKSEMHLDKTVGKSLVLNMNWLPGVIFPSATQHYYFCLLAVNRRVSTICCFDARWPRGFTSCVPLHTLLKLHLSGLAGPLLSAPVSPI